MNNYNYFLILLVVSVISFIFGWRIEGNRATFAISAAYKSGTTYQYNIDDSYFRTTLRPQLIDSCNKQIAINTKNCSNYYQNAYQAPHACIPVPMGAVTGIVCN